MLKKKKKEYALVVPDNILNIPQVNITVSITRNGSKSKVHTAGTKLYSEKAMVQVHLKIRYIVTEVQG